MSQFWVLSSCVARLATVAIRQRSLACVCVWVACFLDYWSSVLAVLGAVNATVRECLCW